MRHVFFVLALLCTALSAGIFYSFSTIIMPGLDLGGAASAVNAMHGMNTTVRGPIFAIVFFGALILPLLAAMFVAEIRGSHSGIVGLPLCETALLLRRFGYPL